MDLKKELDELLKGGQPAAVEEQPKTQTKDDWIAAFTGNSKPGEEQNKWLEAFKR